MIKVRQCLLFILVVTTFTIFSSCSNEPMTDEELFWSEVYDSMQECETDGVFIGKIDYYGGSYIKIGMWCDLVDVPEEVDHAQENGLRCMVPTRNSLLYFRQSDFKGKTLQNGDMIKFRILSISQRWPGFIQANMTAHTAVIEPVD